MLGMLASSLHACMGASCYCRPSNTAHIWTKEDKDRLMNAFREIVELEKGTSDFVSDEQTGRIMTNGTKGG